MCSEEKLALTVGECTVDVGKLSSQVGVRDFGASAVKYIFFLLL